MSAVRYKYRLAVILEFGRTSRQRGVYKNNNSTIKQGDVRL